MTLAIRISGVDITDNVMIEDARFTMANGPNPGDFEFKVKDVAKTYAFRAGEPIEVDFDSVRVFEGYVLLAAQKHGFPVDDTVTEGPDPVERIWDLKGSDLNVLFRKRFIFDQDDPSNPISIDLAAGTSDLTYLNEIVDRLSLDTDNLTFDFHHVGSPNPDRAGIAISIGDSWERVMALTAEIPGGVWGIRPPRTVYYEDDDTETAPFAISDVPDGVTSFGYANFDWLHDGSRLVNDARIWGVGQGQDHLTYTEVRDEASIAEHGRWQNGNGWRYNLYRQTSVALVANSLVYGSPQNLHGPKDDSMVVSCRIKKPGIMPGHKVRIISEVFGEEIVLPVRRYTITFVNRNDAFFDLEMSWDIDAPRSLFDYPPFVIPQVIIPEITIPNPCDDLGLFAFLTEGGGWEFAHNHSWLGQASWTQAEGMKFNPMKRYGQIYGLIGQHGDGISGGHTYVYARKKVVKPTKWVCYITFSVPYASMVNGYHMAPFPEFSSGIWWGAGSNDYMADIALDIDGWIGQKRLLACTDGVCKVAGGVNPSGGNGNADAGPPGTQWTYEILSNGERRMWAGNSTNRPVSSNAPTDAPGGPARSDEPWNQLDFGPDRPWMIYDSDDLPRGYDRLNYIYLMGTGTGGIGYTAVGGALAETVAGNPFSSNGNIQNNFLGFTTGPTVSGTTSGYHEALNNGLSIRIPGVTLTLISLPSTFDFTTQLPIDCGGYIPSPVAGALNCENIEKDTGSDTTYSTTWAFAEGSTTVTLEGVAQRLGIDYDEDSTHQKIVFRHDVLSSAKLYVCYQLVA